MYPNEYILFLVHFHGDRDYFECHEILEEYWKKVDKANKQSIWVAFILLAVSCYHFRRENYSGALKTIRKSLSIFQTEKKAINTYGLSTNKLLTLLKQTEENIVRKKVFQEFDLPISDEGLEKRCKNKAAEIGFLWKSQTSVNPMIINRHLTRDRSAVIQEREKALRMRKQKK